MPALPAQLTEDDKSRIRMHMGYPDVRAAASFVVGFPATIETAFLIETAMNEIRIEALAQVRRILDVLDTIDLQDIDDLDAHIATKVGEIDINPDEHRLLDRRYDKWLARLENLLVVPRNPFDKRFENGSPESINRRVIG